MSLDEEVKKRLEEIKTTAQAIEGINEIFAMRKKDEIVYKDASLFDVDEENSLAYLVLGVVGVVSLAEIDRFKKLSSGNVEIQPWNMSKGSLHYNDGTYTLIYERK